MKRIDRKRLEALARLQEIEEVLGQDRLQAVENYARQASRFTPQGAMNWDFACAVKIAARAFLAEIEGLRLAMQQAVVDLGPELGFQAPAGEPSDLAGGAEGSGMDLSPVAGFELAVRDFSTLFGISFPPDLESEGWTALRRVVEIHHRTIYPETLDHLFGTDLFFLMRPALVEFFRFFGEMRRACTQTIEDAGLSFDDPEIPLFRLAGGREVSFPEKDCEEMREASVLSLEHARTAVKVLEDDTVRAMGLATKSVNAVTLMGVHGQTGWRNLLRTFHVEIEAALFIAGLWVRSSAEGGEVPGSETDLDERIARTLTLWAKALGSESQVQMETLLRQGFRVLQKLQDRLDHPRSVKDLRTPLETMDVFMKAQDWFSTLPELVGLGRPPRERTSFV